MNALLPYLQGSDGALVIVFRGLEYVFDDSVNPSYWQQNGQSTDISVFLFHVGERWKQRVDNARERMTTLPF